MAYSDNYHVDSNKRSRNVMAKTGNVMTLKLTNFTTSKTALILALGCFVLLGCATTKHERAEIKRKHYGSWETDIGYTQVVQVGDVLYLAGVGGEGETLADQLDHIYQTIERILADYKATTRDIVKEVVYTTDMEQLTEAIPLRKKYFENGEYPSATWVQIDRLFLPKMLVEVEVTVQIPKQP